MADPDASAPNYYDRLGLSPAASVQDIRRAYRDLSKLYHPDTTELPKTTAKEKFQALNEAYATLSNPERRLAYDRQIRYSRVSVIQPSPDLNRPVSSRSRFQSSNMYLDPTDRPLSAGEIFALFILGLTFVACLILVIALGITRGEAILSTLDLSSPTDQIEVLDTPSQPEQATGNLTQPDPTDVSEPNIEPSVEPNIESNEA